MSKLKLIAAAVIVAALGVGSSALAQNLGTVTKALRPQLSITDANGAPLGKIKASELKLPQPIVAMGKGNSFGVKQGNRVVYLRGLEVMTDKVKANCKPVAVASRKQGSAYAASNMGIGAASDCSQ
jgi:hypothetical protein